MPRVSAAFFATGVVCALAGMLWGMRIGNTNDFTLAPAHAHLNLLGWVTMSLYGTFYALTRGTMLVWLAWVNYVLALLGALLFVPSLALFLQTVDGRYAQPMVAGEVLTFAAMFVFGISVFRELFRTRPGH
jgi:hypothetical protein